METSDIIKPYQFEPKRSQDDSDSSWETDDDCVKSDSEIEKENAERSEVDAELWCKCNNCQRKYHSIECVCCKELEETAALINEYDLGQWSNLVTMIYFLMVGDRTNLCINFLGCIIDHKSFDAVCLNRDVLWAALVGLADREGAKLPKRGQVPNK